MLDLATLQGAVRDTVLGGDAGALADTVLDGGLGYEARLRVYRNNTTFTLIEALGDTFAVTKKLVGETFFHETARTFLRSQPPASPCLFEFGGCFPAFLETYGPALPLPYLGGVARLEWLWTEAFHAPEAEPVSPSDLGTTAMLDILRLRLKPHPALRLLSSPFPLDAIWAVNQEDADPDATVDLGRGGVNLAILRPHTEVTFLPLSDGGFALSRALAKGKSMEEAFAGALELSDASDLSIALAGLIAGGAFASFSNA